MKKTILSRSGGDRATAYAMSNKIVSLPDGYLCTWIDSRRLNRWALVDRAHGAVLREGALGEPCLDNHCGAALAVVDGAVHAVTGGHHSALRHYRMELPAADGWREVAVIEATGTYPSLVADAAGRLHLTYRASGEPWTLDYRRFERGAWTAARALVEAEKPGYIYWTNGLATGPGGSVHLVFGNTRVMADGALLYGASHLVSADGGATWTTSAGEALALPAPVRSVPLINRDEDARRVQSLASQDANREQGPLNVNYQQILLSNPVVDPAGAVHVVVHNGLAGTADLLSCVAGEWRARALTDIATRGDARWRVHLQSSLSADRGGRLHAALMLQPAGQGAWGERGTHPVRVVIEPETFVMTAETVAASDAACAQWLPAWEHAGGGCYPEAPALLFTRGENAGGYAQNENDVEAEVWLCR